jgi:hypothetical protein
MKNKPISPKRSLCDIVGHNWGIWLWPHRLCKACNTRQDNASLKGESLSVHIFH